MAEEFLNFLEATDSKNSFDDFEEMWARMGSQLEKGSFSARPVTPTPESDPNIPENKTSSSDVESNAPFPRYSPAMDSNWPPSLDSSPSFTITEGGFEQTEDSIVTNLRRTNPEKLRQLEKRMREPEKFKTQMELLRTLTVRVAEDVQQIRIITNHLEDKLDNVRDSVNIKKVRFTTL